MYSVYAAVWCEFQLLLSFDHEAGKSVYEDEELRLYVGMVLGSVLLIVINLRGFYGTLEETVRHVFFQVASIVTTTALPPQILIYGQVFQSQFYYV